MCVRDAIAKAHPCDFKFVESLAACALGFPQWRSTRYVTTRLDWLLSLGTTCLGTTRPTTHWSARRIQVFAVGVALWPLAL
eukprot:3894204-Prymnesium_polylepis.2